MQWFLTLVYSFVCIMLILVVLLQRGKDASGNIFGTGSNALLSSHGTTSFLVKLTTSLAVMFFVLSLTISYLINHSSGNITAGDIIEEKPQAEAISAKAKVVDLESSQGDIIAAETNLERVPEDPEKLIKEENQQPKEVKAEEAVTDKSVKKVKNTSSKKVKKKA